MEVRLVLIETAGNRAYIFATNRLREKIGASDLLYRIGTEWTLAAVQRVLTELTGREAPWLYGCEKDREKVDGESGHEQMIKSVIDPTLNSPFSVNAQGAQVEGVIVSSGKSLLLVDSTETGKRIISEMMARALREAPGAVVQGAISDPIANLDDAQEMEAHIAEVHHRLEKMRSELPSPEQRFRRLLFAAQCATSELSANVLVKAHGAMRPSSRSSVSRAATLRALTNCPTPHTRQQERWPRPVVLRCSAISRDRLGSFRALSPRSQLTVDMRLVSLNRRLMCRFLLSTISVDSGRAATASIFRVLIPLRLLAVDDLIDVGAVSLEHVEHAASALCSRASLHHCQRRPRRVNLLDELKELTNGARVSRAGLLADRPVDELLGLRLADSTRRP